MSTSTKRAKFACTGCLQEFIEGPNSGCCLYYVGTSAQRTPEDAQDAQEKCEHRIAYLESQKRDQAA